MATRVEVKYEPALRVPSTTTYRKGFMQAAFKTGPATFDLRETPLPEIAPTEVLVRIHYCSICVWCYHEWERDGSDDRYGAGVTGHEMAGVIEAIGDNVSGWAVGDRVLTYFSGHCGTCPECLRGETTYCSNPGRPKDVARGYAEYVAAPQQCILPAPEEIPLGVAALIPDMVGTPMHAIRRAFAVPSPRNVVSVWGLGPVGLCTLQGVRAFDGVEKVIAVDPVESRRKLALELGADLALDPTADGFTELLIAESGGRGVDFAFNCALPNPQAAYDTLRSNGLLMNITGSIQTTGQVEKRVDGSFYFFKEEYEPNLELVRNGTIKLEPLISHEFALDDINEAMALRTRHADSLKVVVRMVDTANA